MTPSRGQGPLTPRTRALGKGTAPTAMAEGTPAGRRTALRREVPAGWAKPKAGGDGVHEPRGLLRPVPHLREDPGPQNWVEAKPGGVETVNKMVVVVW